METSGGHGDFRVQRVVSLPMRDGNMCPSLPNLQSRQVVSLPMRDGNTNTDVAAGEGYLVVSLPMRDGNAKGEMKGYKGGDCC